ncbi:hypothetical protein AMS68_007506 [Peltaster fructicola]|uniref:Arf-GAP domain-containing protein n=1 Tax=Peltaster fructicola TaxID=286661 RepID=A0A6H0Y580_9PEZI|nr:hypothetical protein AMS68_007506 [Peltaster fructicola]
MSRRPAPPDQSEKNRATLKQLVKLEANKSCADCKRNKHPRWASWNLGVFICIRCSGIHRSMGVHISRVKSVDLDTWKDEQMESILRWGNARANTYWEAKLAPGHVPNEAKIENFIRTKYDSKRWVMDGPMPDPSTLDVEGADDDTPLNVVQEKAKVERNVSVRNGAGVAPPKAQTLDLFGEVESAPQRPSTTEPSGRAPPPKAAAAPARQTRPGESLLGLDFLGGTQSAPPRPSSTSGLTGTAAPGRADLKNSILSLYASTPKPTPPAQSNAQPDFFGAPAQATAQADFFGGLSSAAAAPAPQKSSSGLGELGDAFGTLSFSSSAAAPSKAPAFSALTSTAPLAQPRQTNALSGGSFFDTKPAPPPKAVSPPAQSKPSNSFGDFGGFESTPAPAPAAKQSSMGDLFNMSSTAPAPAAPKASNPPPISASGYSSAAAFNLSQTKPVTSTPAPVQSQTTSFPAVSNMDAWGPNDAWATPEPAPAPTKAAPPAQTSTSTFKAPAAAPVVSTTGGWGDSGGWGEPETPAKPAPAATSGGGFTVQQDEEFGGWSHASPVATTGGGKPGASGNADDLFGNVWE